MAAVGMGRGSPLAVGKKGIWSFELWLELTLGLQKLTSKMTFVLNGWKMPLALP